MHLTMMELCLSISTLGSILQSLDVVIAEVDLTEVAVGEEVVEEGAVAEI